MQNRSSTIGTEQELFMKTVTTLKSRFGVDDLSTFEVLRIYRECRIVFEAFQQHNNDIKLVKEARDVQRRFALLYNYFDPVSDVIIAWLNNNLSIDVFAFDPQLENIYQECKTNQILRQYISIQRWKLSQLDV